MNMHFPQRLKELRLQNNLSQSQLAAHLHTTQRRISYFESGKVEPDLETLCAIADYFDTPVDYLLGRIEY